MVTTVSSGTHHRASISSLLRYAARGVMAYGLQRRGATPQRQSHNDNQRERRSPAEKRPASGAFGTTRSTDEPRQFQHERARQPGRGRQATAPWQIPWKGWKDILWRTYQQIGEDRLL